MKKLKKILWYLLFFIPFWFLWEVGQSLAKYWVIHGRIFDEAELTPPPPIKERKE